MLSWFPINPCPLSNNHGDHMSNRVDARIPRGIGRCFYTATGLRIVATRQDVPLREHQIRELPGINIESFWLFIGELSKHFNVSVGDIKDTWTLGQIARVINARYFSLDEEV